MLTATNRIFTNVETGYKCRLYTSCDASKYHLIYEGQPESIPDGNEVIGYYLLAHTGGTIRLNNKKQVRLSPGQFYNYKQGEIATHIKYCGFQKFKKLK